MKYNLNMWSRTVCAIFLFVTLSPLLISAQDAGTGDRREARTYTVQHGNVGSLAEVLEQVKSPEGKVTPYVSGNMIVVYDTPEAQARMKEVLSKLDIESKQVVINVLTTEITGFDMQGLGISGREIIPAEEFSRVRYLLESSKASRMSSAMTLRTLSGQAAKLRIADSRFYPETTYYAGGHAAVTSLEERQAGSLLDVIPQVNNDGTIMVRVVPTESAFSSGDAIYARSLMTNVLVNNGDTIVLGGLNASRRDISHEGIPVIDTGINTAEDARTHTVMFLTVDVDE
ncbi:MAG: secretin N-terminal domain-containing protein [Candidatus Omnitrophica bacterium]|nr:secretin N-terminal domain-containing protein [Candidatus Omnitrophota bacterium]